MNKKNLLVSLAVLAILAGLGAYVYFRILPARQPSLDRPYTITIEMPESARTALEGNAKDLTAKLQSDPSDLDAWLGLAMVRKMAGDFEGAEQIWKYVASVGGESDKAISYGNLGDLYMNFYKKPEQAERYINKAIALKPNFPKYYLDQHRLYTYFIVDEVKAEQALLTGIEKTPAPQNFDIVVLLAELYEKRSDYAKVVEQYNRAADIAASVNNKEIEDQMLLKAGEAVKKMQAGQ